MALWLKEVPWHVETAQWLKDGHSVRRRPMVEEMALRLETTRVQLETSFHHISLVWEVLMEVEYSK